MSTCINLRLSWFQHTAARRRLDPYRRNQAVAGSVSTHSRPKAAGTANTALSCSMMFQHTAARRRLDFNELLIFQSPKFQHTAARRRLVIRLRSFPIGLMVSTHSRPKAAGSQRNIFFIDLKVSTHSRPKAAGTVKAEGNSSIIVSTHSRPKAAG